MGFTVKTGETRPGNIYSHSKISRQNLANKINEFNSLSEQTSFLVVLIGTVGVAFLYNQIIRFQIPMSEVFPWSVILAMLLIGSVSVLAFVRLIRQAFLMRQMYLDIQVDVFKPFQIYDLSKYASFSAGSLILLHYVSILMTSPRYLLSLADLITQLIIFLTAAMLFLFPLLGINRRMKHAKDALLIQTGDNLMMVYEQINSAAQKKDFSKLEKVRGSLSALRETKELVENVPTWPWQTSALGNFIYPLLIPLIAFLVQLFIERQFGF